MNLEEPIYRNLFLHEQVDQDFINKITSSIIYINDSDEALKTVYENNQLTYTPQPIKLFIDSYGGTVYQCLGLIGVMEKCKTPIHTIVTGCAMSAGFIIAISGHRRYAYPYATLMYHQVASWRWGKLKDQQEGITETERLQTLLENITARKTKISARKMKEVFNQKVDWYITAVEALNLKVIDEII